MTRLESLESSLSRLNEISTEITNKFGKDCIPAALGAQISKLSEQIRSEKAQIEKEEKARTIIANLFKKAGLEPVFEMHGNNYYRSGKNSNGNLWGITAIPTNSGFNFIASFRDREIMTFFGKADIKAGTAKFDFETVEARSFLTELAKESEYLSTAEFKFMTREIIRVMRETVLKEKPEPNAFEVFD
jgi:hypothetical protein